MHMTDGQQEDVEDYDIGEIKSGGCVSGNCDDVPTCIFVMVGAYTAIRYLKGIFF